jgi:hypothetical protein
MTVETNTTNDRVISTNTDSSNSRSSDNNGKSGLLPGERVVADLSAGNEGKFRLTSSRVIFDGGAESDAVWSAAQLRDITASSISRRPRARRSAAWGVIGLFAAIGVWQVTPSSTIGIVAGIAVAAISLIMMADYWIRPAGVHLEFQTSGGGQIGGEVDEKIAVAKQFANEVEDARRRLVPNRIRTPYRNYPS